MTSVAQTVQTVNKEQLIAEWKLWTKSVAAMKPSLQAITQANAAKVFYLVQVQEHGEDHYEGYTKDSEKDALEFAKACIKNGLPTRMYALVGVGSLYGVVQIADEPPQFNSLFKF